MLMERHNYFICLFLLNIDFQVYAYKTYSALESVVFTNVEDAPAEVHSEYFFGKCAKANKLLVAHDVLEYEDFRDGMIIRGWLSISSEPTCVYIRAKSPYGDIVRYAAFKFGLCVCRIIYNYFGKMYEYYYYEWYIPVLMRDGIEWEIFFYD